MRIISEKRLRQFWAKYPNSKTPLQNWLRTTYKADWNSFSDVKNSFNHSDIYNNCVIFDVGGNNYRLIAKIKYEYKIVYIRFVLTHSEYDNNVWQSDCKSS